MLLNIAIRTSLTRQKLSSIPCHLAFYLGFWEFNFFCEALSCGAEIELAPLVFYTLYVRIDSRY